MNNYEILIKKGDVWIPYSKEDVIIQITESKTAVLPDEVIYFYDDTWPKPTSVNWLFSDGTELDGSEITWSSSVEGTYSVSVIVNFEVGSKSKVYKSYINVDRKNITEIGEPLFS